jgi:hypothetical protein
VCSGRRCSFGSDKNEIILGNEYSKSVFTEMRAACQLYIFEM